MNAAIEIILDFTTTVFAALITVYFTMRYILREQKKAAEMPSKPLISFPHYASETKNIQCLVRQNDAYNINMRVAIDSNSMEKDLGSVFIRSNREEGRSEILDLSHLLSRVSVGSGKILKIKVSYYSPTGTRYTEEFVWKKCEITEKGIRILPRTGSGYYWEISEAPWI